MAFFFRAVETREISESYMTETLVCGHTLVFRRGHDNNGKAYWVDENGRRISLTTKTRQCVECEKENA